MLQDVWFSRAQTYAQKCGLDTWPVVKYPGPSESSPTTEHADHDSEIPLNTGDVQVKKSREQAFTQLQDDHPRSSESNPFPAETRGVPDSAEPEPPLTRCNIWVGDSSNKSISARMDDPDEDLIRVRDGPALIYIPVSSLHTHAHTPTFFSWRITLPHLKPKSCEAIVPIAHDGFCKIPSLPLEMV